MKIGTVPRDLGPLIAALMAALAATAPLGFAATTSSAAQEGFVGLQPGLGTLPLLGRGRTRSISAENPTGDKGRGGMAIPNPGEPKPAASARAADNLGQGWKVRPFIRINAGETGVLMDVKGSGIIQHIWLVEGLNHTADSSGFGQGGTSPSQQRAVLHPARESACRWFRSHFSAPGTPAGRIGSVRSAAS